MDFNNIWKAQAVPGPDLQALYDKIKRYKRRRLKRLVFTNICLILTSVFIIFIGFKAESERFITWAGIVLTVLAMALILAVYNRMIPLYRSLDERADNQHYMEKLLAIKRREAFLHHQMMNLYFILLSLGISLYMYEYASRMELKWGLVTYGVTFLWLGFNWWVLRPKQIRKEQDKINAIIERLQEVQGQFSG